MRTRVCFNVLMALIRKDLSSSEPGSLPAHREEGSPCPLHNSFHPRRRPALSGRSCPPCTTGYCIHSREKSTTLRHCSHDVATCMRAECACVFHEKQLHKRTRDPNYKTSDARGRQKVRFSSVEATLLLLILTFVTVCDNQTPQISDFMAVYSLGVKWECMGGEERLITARVSTAFRPASCFLLVCMMSAPGLRDINHTCSPEPVCVLAGQTDRQTDGLLVGLIKPRTAQSRQRGKHSPLTKKGMFLFSSLSLWLCETGN